MHPTSSAQAWNMDGAINPVPDGRRMCRESDEDEWDWRWVPRSLPGVRATGTAKAYPGKGRGTEQCRMSNSEYRMKRAPAYILTHYSMFVLRRAVPSPTRTGVFFAHRYSEPTSIRGLSNSSERPLKVGARKITPCLRHARLGNPSAPQKYREL